MIAILQVRIPLQVLGPCGITDIQIRQITDAIAYAGSLALIVVGALLITAVILTRKK